VIYTAAEEARLSACHPDAEARFRAIGEAMERRGLPVFIGETARTNTEQAEAVASGHSSEHQVHSWHTLVDADGKPCARACDFRKRLPGNHADPTTHDEAFFRALYAEATITGCRSLAYKLDGTKLLLQTAHGLVWDAGHVEYREPYLSLAEAVENQAVA
jgi:hypothetical protein